VKDKPTNNKNIFKRKSKLRDVFEVFNHTWDLDRIKKDKQNQEVNNKPTNNPPNP
jgi:hypothetical protein